MGTPVQTHTTGATVALVPAPPPCPGDCVVDDAVSNDELLGGVSMALGVTSAAPCFDGNGDEQVTIEEVVAAVDAKLHACPP